MVGPGTEAVVCFSVSWPGENNWLVLPPSMISRCIKKVLSDKCSATLVIPRWFSAPFTPLLISDQRKFKGFIKDEFLLPISGAIQSGRGNNGVFAKEPLSFRMVALKCRF